MRAHGGIAAGVVELVDGELRDAVAVPLRGVAPGQTMVLYRPDADGDEVLGSATIRLRASSLRRGRATPAAPVRP